MHSANILIWKLDKIYLFLRIFENLTRYTFFCEYLKTRQDIPFSANIWKLDKIYLFLRIFEIVVLNLSKRGLRVYCIFTLQLEFSAKSVTRFANISHFFHIVRSLIIQNFVFISFLKTVKFSQNKKCENVAGKKTNAKFCEKIRKRNYLLW